MNGARLSTNKLTDKTTLSDKININRVEEIL